MLMRLLIFIFFVVVAPKVQSQTTSFRLSNGVPVTLNTIEQAKDIAMETMYEVGFLQEPEGMVQASHLLEHLVCYAPCEGFADREAMNFLNRVGSANAETLPTFTHYDYAVPSEHFEKAVMIEADRIQRFSFSQTVMEREAKRCYQETNFVEANASAGMLKHAFMACSHAWRFQSTRALVRGGMETFSSERLKEFHSQFYNPSHLTIAITGSISESDSKRILEKHIGSIASRTSEKPVIDWNKVPNGHVIHWDSKVRGVCIAWQPPVSQAERTALSILGLLAMQKLSSDPKLKSKCDQLSCSNNIWAVGDIPLFVYATVRNEGDVELVETLLADRFKRLLHDSCKDAALQIGPFIAQAQRDMTWVQMQEATPILMKQGRSKTAAIQLCLMQDALNRVLSKNLLGLDRNEVTQALTSKQLSELVDRVVTVESQRVVRILPLDDLSAKATP